MANLPFAAGLASGVDELTGAAPFSTNVLADPGNALTTRPGIVEWSEWACPSLDDSGAGEIIGGVVWPSVNGEVLVYVTEDRRLWAMLGPNQRIALSDLADATTLLDGADRPTFATTKTRVIVAGGGAPQKWEGTGLSARLGGSPPILSHVVANATRLVGSNPTIAGTLYWSDPGETNHETWIDSAEAEARPDPIVATHENSNEVFCFGSETLQLFVPDPTDAYVPGRASNFGCAAPYSVIRAAETFLLLATDEGGRMFAATTGRDLTPISDPDIGKTLDRLGTVSDCWGFRAHIDSWDLAIWKFPTEGRTFVYNAATKQWGEWRSTVDGEDVNWTGTCGLNWKSRNLTLVGRTDGTMGLLDPDAFADDGENLRGLVRTGFIDRGSKNTKACQRLALTMRGSDVASSVTVSWRDDLGDFGQPLVFPLGPNGVVGSTVVEWTLGAYVDRQWQFEFSGGSRLVLASADETFVEASA